MTTKVDLLDLGQSGATNGQVPVWDTLNSKRKAGDQTGNGTVIVDIIFDEAGNRLQDIATDATQIDGVTILDGYLVYVKNSSDATEIGNIYLATVVAGDITWTFHSTPATGSLIYSNYGDIYGGYIYSNVNIITPSTGLSDIYNNYLVLDGTMAGTPPEVDIADTRITDTTPYLVFYETQPVGNITRTLTNGNLHIVSDDNADTLDVKVLFRNIGPARNYMKGNEVLTGVGPRVISDPRFTTTTPAMIMPRTTPVGYITATTGSGVMTISSTGTEVGVVVDYIVTLDTTNYSDGMQYNASLDDDDMLFRKGQSGEDEAFKVSDLKTGITLGNSLAYVSTPQNIASDGVISITHNLGITQADVESGRYKVKFSFKDNVTSVGMFQERCITDGQINSSLWSSGNPPTVERIYFQANVLKFYADVQSSTFNDVRVYIFKNR